MPDRVLATARNVAMVLERYQPELQAAGLEVVFPESAGVTLGELELLNVLPGCFAVIAMPDAYTARDRGQRASPQADRPLWRRL